MKKMLAVVVICLLGASAQAVLVDNFDDGSMSEYTQTVVLDNGTQVPDVSQIVYSASSGKAWATIATYDGVEQSLALRSDYSLGIGQMLFINASSYVKGNQDIGIVVAATSAQTPGLRKDYVNVYMRDKTVVYSRGFDGATGTTEFALSGGNTTGLVVADALFIERIAANQFATGYFSGGVRYNLATRTVINTDIGLAIGLYTDMRAAGTVGGLDNLQIIPEPATLVLLGLGGLLLKRRRA